jgi:hypothetical protein
MELVQTQERLLVNAVLNQRQVEELLLQVEQLRWRMEEANRQLLLEALRPVAAAMQRQDSQQLKYHKEQELLLLEVLNSLQPTAQEQLSQRIGLLPPTSTSRSLAS